MIARIAARHGQGAARVRNRIISLIGIFPPRRRRRLIWVNRSLAGGANGGRVGVPLSVPGV